MILNSGIGTQVLYVLKELVKKQNLDLDLIGNPADIYRILPEFEGKVVPFTADIYTASEQIFFPKIKEGLLHIPHYNAPISQLNRSLVVVHDLIHLQSEEFKNPKFRIYAGFILGMVARKAKYIVTVSEYTKQEMIKRFPAAIDKISVIQNGLDHSLFRPQKDRDIQDFKKKYTLPDHFFLTVGIGKRHKNIDFVIRSLAPLWKAKTIKQELVMAGTGGRIPDYVRKEIDENGVDQFINLMPYLSSEELPLLYASADALIMPSLLEGFGFPVIEAMACGTCVLSSDRSSLPEIAGDAAFYFNPEDSASLSQSVQEFLSNSEERKKILANGIKQSKRFSWVKHAEELIKIYREIEKNEPLEKK